MKRSYSFAGRHGTGFSLIEVLIAVLVLATGMLALAAMQGSITRNSVDAKVRSQGLAVAVDVLDRVRAAASDTNDDYEDLATGTGAWTAWTNLGFGGTAPNVSATYESRTTVTRFVRDSDAADCGGAANVPCFRPAAVGDPYSLNNTAEFKRISVDVRWTDATNTVRNVSVSDLVTSITRELSAAVMNQTPTPPEGVGAPIARIPRPSDAGIIPIAIGDGRETAASNPRPITGRERGRADETTFQVYTYANEAGGVARLTRVIDTRVVGCRCELGALPATLPNNSDISVAGNDFFTTPKQPTYWNGADYVVPAEGVSGLRGVAVSGANQNQDLCVSCCLDHHDFAAQTVKFDSFRSETLHKHYYDPNENDNVIDFVEASGAGERYYEVCRFIRVEGVFRVATDARLELMNLLETEPAAQSSVPLASKISRYQTAVKSFVDQRIIGASSNPDMSSYSDVLTDPTSITLNSIGNIRYLHNRGLYIDYLEPEAVQAVADARTDCPNGTPLIDCVLPVLPFVSINTTDIAQWASETAVNYINVQNLGRNIPYPTGNGNQPPPSFARGYVTAVSNGTEIASTVMQRSNSGLSDSRPIDWLDAGQAIASPHAAVPAEIANDAQSMRVGADPACSGTITNLNVTLNGADLSTVGMNWVDPAPVVPGGCPAAAFTEQNCTGTGFGDLQTVTNPVVCQLKATLPKRMQLRLNAFTGQTQGSNTANPCGNGNYRPYMCQDRSVQTVTAGGSTWSVAADGGVNGKKSEQVLITIDNLPAATPVTIQFQNVGTPVANGYTCSNNSAVPTPC